MLCFRGREIADFKELMTAPQPFAAQTRHNDALGLAMPGFLEAPMMRCVILFCAFALLTSAALGHHGWGSYDASKPVTVTGPIATAKFENPHATITVRGNDKVWTVTLAPPSRMSSRGATEKIVAVGQNVSAYGYPSTVEKDEMRAERITVNGKTYEMR
jgi:hypothetical protein